jgi:nitrile hydratase subunit beta
MDGIHDLGGKQGFGRVQHTVNSLSYHPVFHEKWENLGYSLAFLGAAELQKFSIDELRHAIERMEPAHYLTSSYYDRIIIGTATLLVEKGVLTQEELDSHAGGAFKLAQPAGEGRPPPSGSAGFSPGDVVRVKNEFVRGHIRMPAYVRGKRGVILHRTTQAWHFPDEIGHGPATRTEATYHVCFEASELWGSDVEDGSVVVDLFEGYLAKAQEKTQEKAQDSADVHGPGIGQ